MVFVICVIQVAESPQVQANSTRTYNLTGLKYPHTLYDIRVSMRSSKALESNEKIWSKNVSTTVRTMSACKLFNIDMIYLLVYINKITVNICEISPAEL